MYSLFAKKESAHEDAIWTCVWGRRPERTETEEVEVEVEVEEEEVSELVNQCLSEIGTLPGNGKSVTIQALLDFVNAAGTWTKSTIFQMRLHHQNV